MNFLNYLKPIIRIFLFVMVGMFLTNYNDFSRYKHYDEKIIVISDKDINSHHTQTINKILENNGKRKIVNIGSNYFSIIVLSLLNDDVYFNLSFAQNISFINELFYRIISNFTSHKYFIRTGNFTSDKIKNKEGLFKSYKYDGYHTDIIIELRKKNIGKNFILVNIEHQTTNPNFGDIIIKKNDFSEFGKTVYYCTSFATPFYIKKYYL